MITGFNTDVVHDGVTYHVQTEDKGLQTPLILSLVYHGGAILASRRTPYNDLIVEGFQESVLSERLHRQHKLICAAIKAGRLKDLQRKSEPQAATLSDAKLADVNVKSSSPDSPSPDSPSPDSSSPLDLPALDYDTALSQNSSLIELSLESPPIEKTASSSQSSSQSPTVRIVKAGVADFARVADNVKLPQLTLLDEQPLQAGEQVKLQVRIFDDAGNNRKFAGVSVKIKIIGTAFQPVQQQSNANGESVATFNLQLPAFTTGRAVLLITANIGGYELELRRIINQLS